MSHRRVLHVQVFTITVPPGHEGAVQALVTSLSPAARRTYCLGGTLKYELPVEDVALSHVFDRMAEARAEGLPVLDWGVHNASLEDVFIRLATEQSAEAAQGTDE